MIFLIWCVIPLEVAIGRWVHCRDRCGQQQYSSSLRHSSNALLVVRGPKCANKISQQMISFWNTQTTGASLTPKTMPCSKSFEPSFFFLFWECQQVVLTMSTCLSLLTYWNVISQFEGHINKAPVNYRLLLKLSTL